MTTSSSKPSPSDVPSHYLPIPAAQDESSWRTYINGRKGKGRATKEAEESAQAADTADSSMNGHGTVSVEAAEPLGDGIPGEDSSSPLVDGTSETTAIQAEPTATAKSVRTDPRPPIPTLMRALDHVSVIPRPCTIRQTSLTVINSASIQSFPSLNTMKFGSVIASKTS